jgi:membrane protease YdiL (CAAX protease family)
MAISLLLINRLINDDYRSALNFGYFESPTQYFSWIGISNGTPWRSAVTTFLVFPLIATTLVVYLQIARKKNISIGTVIRVLPAAVLLSVFNSFTEEIIFRVIGIEGLGSTLSVGILALLSGLWFGIPHYFGTPGKFPGVVMAGFLGWIAAISILETGGFAAAWGIHFVQDVPIITMLLAVAVEEARH